MVILKFNLLFMKLYKYHDPWNNVSRKFSCPKEVFLLIELNKRQQAILLTSSHGFSFYSNIQPKSSFCHTSKFHVAIPKQQLLYWTHSTENGSSIHVINTPSVITDNCSSLFSWSSSWWLIPTEVSKNEKTTCRLHLFLKPTAMLLGLFLQICGVLFSNYKTCPLLEVCNDIK